MKKKLIQFGIFILLLLILSLITLYYLNTHDNMHFKYEYEMYNNVEYSNHKTISIKIKKNNTVKYVTEKEMVEKLEKGTGILYFGYATCPWCRNVAPIITDFAIEKKLPIYYLDIHDIKKENKKINELLKDYLTTKEDNKKVLSVPNIFFIKDGHIVGNHLSTVPSYKNPYVKMNNEQEEELINIYEKLYEEWMGYNE